MELCRYPCENKTRYFHICAIQIPIVYNKYGVTVQNRPNRICEGTEQIRSKKVIQCKGKN